VNETTLNQKLARLRVARTILEDKEQIIREAYDYGLSVHSIFLHSGMPKRAIYRILNRTGGLRGD